MNDHTYLDGPTLVDMIGIDNCDYCEAGPAIRIHAPDRWDLVNVHDITCPQSNYSQRREPQAA